VTPDYSSQWAAITAVAQKLGIGTAETVRKWVRRAEVDDGRRAQAGQRPVGRLRPDPAVSGPHACVRRGHLYSRGVVAVAASGFPVQVVAAAVRAGHGGASFVV